MSLVSPAQDKPSDRSAAKAGAGSTPKGAAKPGAKPGAKPAAAPRRMSREASLALVLLPVLLVAGFLLGGQLLSPDDEPASVDAASTPSTAAETESEPADDEVAG